MTEAEKLTELKDFFKSQKKVNRYLRYYLENCVRCGNCIDSCHYYQGDNENALHAPVYKNEQVRRFLKQNSFLGRLGLYGKPKDDYIDSLAYAVFESCSNCRRCVMYCPLSIDISLINTIARAGLIKIDKSPEMLQMLADMQIERRRNIAEYAEMFKEQLTELVTQVKEEIGDTSFDIPVAEKGMNAEFLYVPLSAAITIESAAKIFHAAGQSWALSKYDIVNFGFLVGDSDKAKKILKPIFEEAKEIGAKKLIIGECGHPLKLAKVIANGWWGKQPFEIELITETVARYITENKIKLDKSKNTEPYTHHDPCQHARNFDIIDEPRLILREAVSDFREMDPHGAQNWCCGGGGGIIAVPDFTEVRRKGGQPKVEQIRATGAKVVTTTCENCKAQLEDLNEHFELDVRIEGLIDAVARALVYE